MNSEQAHYIIAAKWQAVKDYETKRKETENKRKSVGLTGTPVAATTIQSTTIQSTTIQSIPKVMTEKERLLSLMNDDDSDLPPPPPKPKPKPDVSDGPSTSPQGQGKSQGVVEAAGGRSSTSAVQSHSKASERLANFNIKNKSPGFNFDIFNDMEFGSEK